MSFYKAGYDHLLVPWSEIRRVSKKPYEGEIHVILNNIFGKKVLDFEGFSEAIDCLEKIAKVYTMRLYDTIKGA